MGGLLGGLANGLEGSAHKSGLFQCSLYGQTLVIVCCPRPLTPPVAAAAQAVLGRPASNSNRGSMIMVKVNANGSSGGAASPRPGTPRLVPKQD